MAKTSSLSSVGKWAAGIAATVIGAVLIWWLTHAGGPLNPLKPTPSAAARPRIIEFVVGPAVAGESARANFSIYNDSDVAAEDCKVWWYSGGKVGRDLERGLRPGEAATSAVFGLRPKDTHQVEVRSLIYPEPGNFRSTAEVSCLGVNVTSQQLERDVVVQPHP